MLVTQFPLRLSETADASVRYISRKGLGIMIVSAVLFFTSGFGLGYLLREHIAQSRIKVLFKSKGA